jgi:uncharacterized protein
MAMNPQERDVISGIFDRLKQGSNAPREAEAEKFIADQISRQPYAPYVMTQSLYVQEQAINNMQKRIEELEGQLSTAQAQKPASGGFLSSIFGSAPAQQPAPQQGGAWGNRTPAQQQQQYAPQPQQQGGPWGGAPQQAAPAAGGGFMASAMTTAAGVAGGMLAANAISSMFSGHGNSAHAAGNANQSNSGYDNGYADSQQDNQFDAEQARQDAYDDGAQDAAGYDDGGSGSYDE